MHIAGFTQTNAWRCSGRSGSRGSQMTAPRHQRQRRQRRPGAWLCCFPTFFGLFKLYISIPAATTMSSEIRSGDSLQDNAPAGPAGLMAPTERRVPSKTSRLDSDRINERTISNVKSLRTASFHDITTRIRRLQWEWDIERLLSAFTAALIIATLAVLGLGLGHPVAAMLLAGGNAGFLLVHSVQGWCPPLPLFRKLGVRTSYEIMDELAALRMLRGDFDSLMVAGASRSVQEDRRGDMIESFARNMNDSGRLLGAI